MWEVAPDRGAPKGVLVFMAALKAPRLGPLEKELAVQLQGRSQLPPAGTLGINLCFLPGPPLPRWPLESLYPKFPLDWLWGYQICLVV